MTLQEILLGGGGGLALLLTLIQIAPVKVNPWSSLARALGRAFNGEVISRLDGLEKTLCDHIHTDEEHNASVVPLDTSAYAWLDGLTFDSYEEAAAAHDLGEAAYNAKVQQETAMTLEAQITDLQLALAELYEKML